MSDVSVGMIWQTLKEQLLNEPSGEVLFNPYSDTNPALDIQDADTVRRSNLRKYLQDHRGGVSVLLVAEAPGPWGCRFSGVPITSESQLCDPAFPLDGRQTSLEETPHTEYSAAIYWRTLQPYYRQVLTWNTVPMHPHHPDRPLSIRTPRQTEINRFLPLLEAVVDFSQADTILAIGRKAENALGRIGIPVEYIRHPSQGGARLFSEGVQRVIQELDLHPDSESG